ncbi:MAG: DUF3180 domain-containing protein [Nocardioidaceae bacterium]
MRDNGLRRSSPVVLTIVGAIGLIVGRGIRPVLEAVGKVPPTVGWSTPLALFFLAAVLGGLAWSTYQALHKKRMRMRSERAVRLLALAKASALVGVFVFGGYLGFGLSYIGDLDITLPRERAVRSGVACIAAALAVAAALFLERACEVPHDDDEDGDRSTADGEDGAAA